MKNMIRYPAKFYIVSFVLGIVGLLLSVIGFCILWGSDEVLAAIFYILIFFMSAVDIFFTLYDLQWVKIDNTHISTYNIFGLVKELELSKIKKVITTNASVFGIKSYTKRFSCIAVSHRKSLRQSEIVSAYNRKRNFYVIFPDSENNRQKLISAYLKATGEELRID